MSAAAALEPAQPRDGDLLEVLRPKTLLIACALSAVFAFASLHNAGKPLLMAVVAAGCVIALLSPQKAFVLCVFLFAFRNDAFAIGPLKIADPLLAVTAGSWLIHTLLQGRLRLHFSLAIVGLYLGAGILSGLSAQWTTYYALEAMRWGYVVLIYWLALQMMGSRQVLLSSVKAFMAAGLVMAVCSLAGLADKFVLHGDGQPFLELAGRFGMTSIAVDPVRVSSFMVFPMMLVCGLQQRAATPGTRRLAALLFWLGFATCLLSFSRSSFLQILPALTVIWLLTGRHLRKLLLIVGAVLFALVAVALMNPNNPMVKQYGLQRWAIAGKLASEHAEPREVIWSAAMQAFQQHPVIGIGLNNFLPRYFEFRDPWLASGWIYWNQKATHSTYMEALVNTGLLGLSSCLLMMGYFVVLGWKVARQARADGDPVRYMIAAAAVAAFAGQIVGGIALDLLSHNHVWIIMATLAVLDRPRPAQAETAALCSAG